ncbi:MAG: hypothetical protein ACI91O_001590 [Candidatus Poriferisodalaceae bacterium]|jgi:hypothetical protein
MAEIGRLVLLMDVSPLCDPALLVAIMAGIGVSLLLRQHARPVARRDREQLRLQGLNAEWTALARAAVQKFPTQEIVIDAREEIDLTQPEDAVATAIDSSVLEPQHQQETPPASH